VVDANPTLTLVMSDADLSVRAEALVAWLAIRRQPTPSRRWRWSPIRPLWSAAGGRGDRRVPRSDRPHGAEAQLGRHDPVVRRNAAWALVVATWPARRPGPGRE
jgi:hypothetical protein